MNIKIGSGFGGVRAIDRYSGWEEEAVGQTEEQLILLYSTYEIPGV